MNNRWQLYKKKDYEAINSILDSRFNELISIAKTQVQCGEDSIISGQNVRIKMEKFMGSIDGYGASDTEPRAILFERINSELEIDSL